MPGGRPSKLTPEIQDRIVAAIRAGNYVETAARHAGIDPATFYRWMERGAKERSGKYREFRKAVEKARADAEVRHVAIIAQAATKRWEAAAWWLERSFPDRWGRRRYEVEHSGTVQFESAYDALAPLLGRPDVARLAAALARALEAEPGGVRGAPEPGRVETSPAPGDS